jgi:hypothetical protein
MIHLTMNTGIQLMTDSEFILKDCAKELPPCDGYYEISNGLGLQINEMIYDPPFKIAFYPVTQENQAL